MCLVFDTVADNRMQVVRRDSRNRNAISLNVGLSTEPNVTSKLTLKQLCQRHPVPPCRSTSNAGMNTSMYRASLRRSKLLPNPLDLSPEIRLRPNVRRQQP